MTNHPAGIAAAPTGTVAEEIESAPLAAPGLRVFRTRQAHDARGWVAPTFNAAYFAGLGIRFAVVHENHCYSSQRGTVRGFHYQVPPHGQAKLIRVTRGRIYDVNVDLRKGSPTFGEAVGTELAAGGWDQIFVPVGFAHCYCTLENDTEVFFSLGCGYAPNYARGLRWNDPALHVQWPISEAAAIVLQRDLDRPPFGTLDEFFPYPTE